jgi:hypothetical protein
LSQAARVPRWPLALLPFVFEAAPLHAEPSEEAVRFLYTAPPACPDLAAFTARVRERTSRGRLAEPGELARSFSIEVAADADGFAGDIAFLDDGGTRVARHLHGEQCDAVVSSLALITALALDATLREEEAPQPASKPEVPSPVAPRIVASKPETKAPPPPIRRRALVGARVGIAGGYGSLLHALDLGLAPRLAVLGQLDWRGGSSLRLSAHYDWHDVTVDEGRRAQLRLLGVETSACPWRFHEAELAFAPCATLDLGSLRAQGERGDKLPRPDGKTIFWAAVGGELRLAWEPDGPFWVELRAAATLPLVATHRFRFLNPTQLVYEVPVLTGSGSTAVGVRFW